MRPIAAVGIGGTNFHYAAGTADGELLTEIETEPTAAHALVDQLVAAVGELDARTAEPLAGVSIACRGLVDHERGAIEKIDVNNGTTRRRVDLLAPVEREFGLAVSLENDCTAAALAEYVYGAGRAHDSLVHVTIGTGIGAGVIDNGNVVRGETNFAGEVGGIPVGPADGLECFGIAGAWEAYCSGPGILEYVESQLVAEERATALREFESLAPQDVFAAAGNGDAVAAEYLETVARYNAAGVGTIANLYDPGAITVGGGVAQNNRAWLLDGLDAHLDDFLIGNRPDVSVTEFEEEIGIYGALAAFRHDGTGLTGAGSAPEEGASRS